MLYRENFNTTRLPKCDIRGQKNVQTFSWVHILLSTKFVSQSISLSLCSTCYAFQSYALLRVSRVRSFSTFYWYSVQHHSWICCNSNKSFVNKNLSFPFELFFNFLVMLCFVSCYYFYEENEFCTWIGFVYVIYWLQ